ncbi:hypothetical protein K438DRAFT_1825558 [Mycena galopus ATCC 62051]|nr:hypothetical protein K438DRAFT_1825558 [Mycena galopus ATCC 62051]
MASKGLGGQWGAEPWGEDTKARLRAEIDALSARRWIAEVDGEPAGYLLVMSFRPTISPFLRKTNSAKRCTLRRWWCTGSLSAWAWASFCCGS